MAASDPELKFRKATISPFNCQYFAICVAGGRAVFVIHIVSLASCASLNAGFAHLSFGLQLLKPIFDNPSVETGSPTTVRPPFPL
jgi:hypothetical protein